VETLARTVDDNGGAYIVPAFSGLFAPYWRSDARGVIAGLTRYVNKGHIARAVLEANAYQTLDIMEAMKKDSGVDLNSLKVDGGMVANELLMQFQSDLLGVPVIRPAITETTALGAAYAAGLAVGFWTSMEDLRQYWSVDKTWEPRMDDDRPAEKTSAAGKRRFKTWIGLTAWSIEDWFTATYATPIDFEIDDALEKLKRLNLCKQTGTDYTGLPVLRAVPLSKACERLDCVGPLFSDAFAGIGMIPSFWRP
jgi:hypothetical protein